MKHVLVAPNAFKHSLDAGKAAEAISLGLRQSNFHCQVTCFPIGDGGDGTCKLIHDKLGGDRCSVLVHDPLGRKINASYSLIYEGTTAIIEMADASGIRLLAEEDLNPMKASSLGTGELIKHALDQGVNHIILGMGGSATVDGACGIMHALGIRFLDKTGNALYPSPQELSALADIDLHVIHPRLATCRITVMCDVTNKLLGKEGAAAVFGPQKGATEEQVNRLDQFLACLNSVVEQRTGRTMAAVPAGGTAGGAAAGMYAMANAELVNGIDYFLELMGFQDALATADWLITGEGSLDEQTLDGKGPFGVAKLARERAIPVIGIAGRVPLQPSAALARLFDVLLPISHEALSPQQAFALTGQNLQRTAQAAGNLIAAATKFVSS